VREVSYRYELRCREAIVATGRLKRERPLQVGDAIAIGRFEGIVREIDPTFGTSELRLVIRLVPERESRAVRAAPAVWRAPREPLSRQATT
jgi:hypothetical protein